MWDRAKKTSNKKEEYYKKTVVEEERVVRGMEKRSRVQG